MRFRRSLPTHSASAPAGTVRRAGWAAAPAALLALALALTGCTRVHTTSPSTVRQEAGTTGKGAFGSVDCRKAKCIALTFDAGPSKNTAKLLDVLKDKQVHATFFLLGKKHVERYPDMVKRMAAEGHEVASHTWSHKILPEIDPKEIREELRRPDDAIERITGRRPTLVRPPQGRTNDTVQEIAREMGLSEVLWSVTAKDYETSDSALITKRVLDQADRDGIILLHDVVPGPTSKGYRGTLKAVPDIIDALKKRGFTFVTVPQLLAPGTPQPGAVYRP
ncbi:polysaccharide deacetylase family protein [Actinacidiphila sp. bgisy167]|uniref:polysaccharide deacetylase family protein n=1 Tax=Actinacidiphila sp. bgisy167 TaxID=3413797 RepID=UPI003D7259AE